MNTIQQLIVASLVAFAGIAVAQESTSNNVDVGDELPPHVRTLLIQEMQAVLTATQTVMEGIVKGQHEIVAEQAEGIHNSIILKQKMTPADREAFKAVVPDAFVQRDRAFHQLSADLAKAARAEDQVQERVLFGQMVEACAGCHSEYARGRFSGLKTE